MRLPHSYVRWQRKPFFSEGLFAVWVMLMWALGLRLPHAGEVQVASPIARIVSLRSKHSLSWFVCDQLKCLALAARACGRGMSETPTSKKAAGFENNLRRVCLYLTHICHGEPCSCIELLCASVQVRACGPWPWHAAPVGTRWSAFCSNVAWRSRGAVGE